MILVDALDATTALIRVARMPDRQVDQDALVIAAMRLGSAVLDLAQRIVEAQAELDAQANDRRPYPKDPKPPKPPADPKPKDQALWTR